MKTVICRSGLKGWQQKLRKNYDNDFEQFKSYCEIYNIHMRLGFDSPEKAWETNPTIQGSSNPSDLKVV